MTDATSPRSGSLEWLADAQPDDPAVVDAPSGAHLSRREHDDAASALARGLAAEHGVVPGMRVAVRAVPGPELLLALYAIAKLGAAPVLLPSALPVLAASGLARTADAALLISDAAPAAAPATGPMTALSTSALAGLRTRHAVGDRLLSGAHAPADNVQCTELGAGPPRLVVRARTTERIALLAPAVGDLLARVALPPGTSCLLGGSASENAEAQFWASVALVTGGGVVTEPATDPASLLHALAGHEAGAAVLSPATLRAIVALPEALLEEADLTGLVRIIACGAPLDAALVEAAADLFGEDVLHAVHASAQTGPFAHADAAALHVDATQATPLVGVEVTADAVEQLLVRSALTADGALGGPTDRGGWPLAPAWRKVAVPTGWAGTVGTGGRLSVRGAARTA